MTDAHAPTGRATRRTALVLALAFASISMAPTPVAAQGGAGAAGAAGGPSSGSCSSDAFDNSLGMSESSGDWEAVNQYGFVGKYQMGEAVLRDLGYAAPDGDAYDNKFTWTGKNGATSRAAYLSNPSLQTQIKDEHHRRNQKVFVERLGWNKYVGTTINGVKVTQSGLLAAAHLKPGATDRWLKSGGAVIGADANGTTVQNYMNKHGRYDVSRYTNDATDVEGSCGQAATADLDKTSRTCRPTVAMLDATPCGRYPGSLRGFCQRYKPELMNMSECRKAEDYAENAPPDGPQRAECERQTFGTGTGSWSYVLGCANASPAGELVNSGDYIMGTADDPACYERLKSKGVTFKALGKYMHSSGGRQCVIANALAYRGKSLSWGGDTRMSCQLAEALETYSDKIKGFGVTSYEGGLGTVGECRPIINDKGVGKKTSLHGLGFAADIFGVSVGGRKVMSKHYRSSAATRAVFDPLVRTACQTFPGVLAWKFYKSPSISHLHVQVVEKARRTECGG